MIKAKMTNKAGVPTYVLGLSELNVRRLKEGKPILFPTEAIGMAGGGYISIIYGETEQAMLEEFRQHGVELPVTWSSDD